MFLHSKIDKTYLEFFKIKNNPKYYKWVLFFINIVLLFKMFSVLSKMPNVDNMEKFRYAGAVSPHFYGFYRLELIRLVFLTWDIGKKEEILFLNLN